MARRIILILVGILLLFLLLDLLAIWGLQKLIQFIEQEACLAPAHG